MGQSFKQSEEWESLLSILRLGKSDPSFRPVLWVGAGLSVSAGYPTTNQLIEQVRKYSVKTLPAFTPWDATLEVDSPQRSFTHWIQKFANENSYGRLSKALASIFTKLPNEPTVTHKPLVELPWKSIFTTNYDQLLEAALDRVGKQFNLVTQEHNFGLEQSDIISLYKIHGGLSNIRDWTLDEKSYLKFADKYPFLDHKLKDTLFPHSLIFVGCSMLDPRVIDWYRLCEEQNKLDQLEYSIAIIRKDDWQQLPEDLRELYKKAQIRPLLFEQFDELPLLFEELAVELSAPEQIKELHREVVVSDAVERQEREAQQLEDLLYETLAPCIVEVIAGVWLEADVGVSHIECLKNIKGAKAVNKGKLAFNSLLDDFVDLINKLVGTKLDFIEKKALIQEVYSLFKQNTPTFDALERVNFDPHALYGGLKINHLPNQQYHEGFRLIFEKILKELCELIVDCSQALPAWTSDNLLVQLDKHEELFIKLREELLHWQEAKEENVDEASLLEEEYRRAIARRFDELRIFGVNFGKRARKYQLSVAYISLTTETEYNETGDSKVMSTSEALTSFDRLVILGEAGQGKTTLLQWLTVQCGRRAFPDDKKEWNQKIPVLIQLRKVLNDEQLPLEPDFYSLMAEQIEVEQVHREWVNSVLVNRQAILMIDGFDEVPKSRRAEVLDWIEALCEKYAGNQFILTSRPSAYENCSLDDLGFQVIQLQTMDRKAQQDFVEHWHHAIALEYDKTQPDALNKEAKNLLQQLYQQRSLRHLAQNPLLCGVICMLHHDRSGYLPKDRTDLYDSTCRMFLDSRDREKKIIEDERFMLLDYRYKQTFLCDVAQWMTQNERTSISPDELLARFSDKLNNLPELKQQLSTNDLVLFFLERSGLLQKVGLSEVQFAHRTFQEFFTAEYLMAEKDWESLKKNAGNDYWNETIQLAVGLCKSKKDNEKFLTDLLQQAEKFEYETNSLEAIPLYLLVLRCKESMREISPEFAKRLEGIIPKVVPPPTAKIRDALVAAGDLALPYLKRSGRQAIQKDHYCALALIKMATPEAYVLLKDYLKDRRASYLDKLYNDIKKMDSDVAKEARLSQLMIADGVDSFPLKIRSMIAFLTQDPQLLPSQVKMSELDLDRWSLSQGLRPFDAINEEGICKLDLSYLAIDDLEPLSRFTQLQELDLIYSKISDFSSLAKLINLQKLNLSGTDISNLSGLSGLTQLQELDCSYTDISDLSGLSGLTQLQELDCSYTDISDLSGLSGLTQLQELDLSGTGIGVLSGLSGLTQLQELDLSGTEISDLSGLSGLTQLQELDLSGTEISDLSDLSGLTQLQELDLSGTKIGELSGLSGLTQLQELHLSGTKIGDFSGLSELTQLKKLDLHHTDISDLSGLSGLTQLQELDCSYTNISDLNGLSGLTQLQELDCSYTDISDLSGLSGLIQLEKIDLSFVKVNELTPLSQLLQLKYINLMFTEVEDLTPLAELTQLQQLDVRFSVISSVKGLPQGCAVLK